MVDGMHRDLGLADQLNKRHAGLICLQGGVRPNLLEADRVDP